ncbi:uncharacterized protein B0J16DRAFT_361049 [Fusarium flagelliforme]|uniref:uncharacterized protein n=1 Tax=Fusarium flagelliforme TaxID=2675880 RepID=UPI001E8DB37B|nr:uncharacterized protein B0J16DRAFT_361049 [Fusarium flagelliforme]KAH7192570.1 hypothetical protein B0J16DRAFT_361049 [Fusarium flagelliforme]
MAELASAILSFVVAGLATWRKIDRAIKAIKNGPRNEQHWKVVGGVLKESLTLMDKRIRARQADLTAQEQNLCKAIRKFTDDFAKDLARLEEKIPRENTGNRYLSALRQKLEEDQDLLERVSRNVQIFQLSAQALSLHLLEGISDQNPEKLDDDEKPDLDSWREALYELIDMEAQRDLPDPALNTPLSITSSELNGNETPRRLSEISTMELRYRFEAAVSRSKRMYNNGLPLSAKKAHDEAMKHVGGMDKNGISDVDLVDIEILHVRILEACTPHSKSYGALAFERLQSLKAQLLEQPGHSVDSDLGHEQKEAVGAIDLLRSSLDGYSIQLISRVVCEQYECLGQGDNLVAFKRILSEHLHCDPTSEPNALATTIEWCHQHGVQTMESQGRLLLHEAASDMHIQPEVFHQLMLAVDHATPDQYGDTPLLVAVQLSNHTALKALLRVSDLVHVWNGKGETPLHLCDNERTLKLLLEEIKKPVHRTPAEERNLKLVHIDSTDAYGSTALHKACEKGNPGTVRLLLEEGADANLVSGLNETPLVITCAPNESKGKGKLRKNKDREQIFEMLVNHGAKATYRDSRGKLVVHQGLYRNLKARTYSEAEINTMVSPDPGRRFIRTWDGGRNSQSSTSWSRRQELAATGAISPVSPVELAADAVTGPFELEAMGSSVLTPPSSCRVVNVGCDAEYQKWDSARGPRAAKQGPCKWSDREHAKFDQEKKDEKGQRKGLINLLIGTICFRRWRNRETCLDTLDVDE